MKVNKRLFVLFYSVIAICVILVMRLFYIQIVKGSFFAQGALLQKTGDVIEKVRGGIYDRNGESLTGAHFSDFAIISPDWLTTHEKYLLVKYGILESIHEKCVKNVNITHENYKIISELNRKTPGIFFYNKINRYGPTALATHVVGFQGQTGIERALNNLLEGDTKKRYFICDGLGQPIAGLISRNQMPESWGVKLTIDKSIQKIVENIMDKNVNNGAIIVMGATTGEILAMASRPNYKQYLLKEYLDQKNAPLINRAVESYTPGSIFKIIILAAALEEELAQLDEIFYCSGFERVGNNSFKCSSYENGGHKEVTLKDALAFSCNSVFIQLGLKLGKDKILDYAKLLGLGEKTSIGLPEEKRGNIPTEKEVYFQDIGNLSIGQGAIGLTPIQAAQIFLIITNNGEFKKPVLLKEVIDQKGNCLSMGSAKIKTESIISAETTKKIREALEAAAEYGTARKANPQMGCYIGGKTGTAEIENNTPHAWFVGYCPAKEPEFIVTVFVEQGGSGSTIAAPIFKEIIERIYNFKGK